MALESSFSPASLGLTWKVAAPTEGLASRVAVLDPDTPAGSDAALLQRALAPLEHLVGAAEDRAAKLRGDSPGQARCTLGTALAFSDRTCVVPGRAMPYGLEFDHVHDVARVGATELDDLRRAATATG